MDNNTKQRIIEFNKKFGLNTEFITDENILGYALGNTIYINSSIEQDYERTNKHELLHFFEDSEEFQKLKQRVLKDNEGYLNKIRAEYELRYFGLYSENEIKAGVLDNEIVIDLLIHNSVIKYHEGLIIGNTFLGNTVRDIEQKRYLNMTLKKNIKEMNLSKWEKLFVANYYNGKDKTLPQGKERIKAIKKDIEVSLQELYELDESDFVIDSDSPEVIREYESNIKALKQRGENTDYFEIYKDDSLKKLANSFSKQLWEEYKHIVDFLKGEEYEPAFKYLMLNETLTKTYRKDVESEKTKTIVKNRKLNQSIAGHMVLNKTTLDVMYNNLESYDTFANLYFAALEVFNKTIANKNQITIEDVETFGKGKWLKFEGKTSNEKEYIKNAEKLASLVKNTPWCTKELASRQLAEGDFFVFVDNEGNPHIAVKTSGDEIDEVRGIQNGNAQELEEEYRDVALAFLDNNKEIPNGKEWLEKEAWNKRLIEYGKKIDAEEFSKEDIQGLIDDLLNLKDYKAHSGYENSNKARLRNKLKKIKGLLAEYFECDEEEICTENIDFSKTDFKMCPYKIIFGNAKFANSQIKDFDNLQMICGDANFQNCDIIDLRALQIIVGNAYFKNSQITEISNLQRIGGNADFRDSNITDISNLQRIGGSAEFENSNITDISNLQSIGGDADFHQSQITALVKLQSIGGYATFYKSQITDIGNLQSIGENAVFSYSQIRSLGSLQTIGGDAYLQHSNIEDLGSLQTIGGNVEFYDSKITSLGKLKRIEGDAHFEDSNITDFGDLEYVGGNDYFGDNIELKKQYEELMEKRKREKEELKLIGKNQIASQFTNSVCDFANIESVEEVGRNDYQNV